MGDRFTGDTIISDTPVIVSLGIIFVGHTSERFTGDTISVTHGRMCPFGEPWCWQCYRQDHF